MASDVNQAIAAYLEKIHKEVIFPVIIKKSAKVYRPDRLVLFQEGMMRGLLHAVTLFRPSCKSDADCASGKCINGKCGSVVKPLSLEAIECTGPGDCRQTELCIDGECVPSMMSLVFQPAAAQPAYGAEVTRAFEQYSGRIYEALTSGLAENPRQLNGVRNVLMQMYADAAIAAGSPRGKCEEQGGCEDGKWCVAGICVPVPFRLVFQDIRIAQPDPWKQS
jgi:hypothetical protein